MNRKGCRLHDEQERLHDEQDRMHDEQDRLHNELDSSVVESEPEPEP